MTGFPTDGVLQTLADLFRRSFTFVTKSFTRCPSGKQMEEAIQKRPLRSPLSVRVLYNQIEDE